MKTAIFYLGVFASTLVPFFNIPLMLKIWRRKSAKDISLVWTVGVWICVLFMLPQALLSSELSFKLFGVTNFVLFTLVVLFVYRYRRS